LVVVPYVTAAAAAEGERDFMRFRQLFNKVVGKNKNHNG